MKTKKLTTAGKLVIFLFVLIIAGVGTFFAGGFNFLKKSSSASETTTTPVQTTTQTVTTTSKDDAINLSLSEKIDWKPILDANGGLTTKSGSIYDKLGIKVNIKLDNNPDNSSQDFINNKSNGLGYTVNGYADYYKKFQDAKVDTVMPYIVDSSAGGDGIIVRGNINNTSDFVGKKIGVPKSSSDQAIVLWLMLKSDLTKDQFDQIKNNMVVYPSVKEVAAAFFKGDVDVAGVRQPYLTQARNTDGTKVMFTTKSATNIVANGIIFRKDFADAHQDVITKFIDGAFQTIGTKGYDNVKLQPSFKNSKDADLDQMVTELKYNGYSENVNLLGGLAQKLYEDMNNVWQIAGDQVVPGSSTQALTDSYVKKLSDKYKLENVSTAKVDDTTKQKAQSQTDAQALLKKSATINFQPNSSNFLNPEEAAQALDQFVDIAKFLDGAVIQIEGNVAKVGTDDEVASKKLSEARANTVAKYLQDKGVEPSRFIVVGNGTSKQVGDNSTTEGQVKNRRTDIFFKIIE